MSTRASTSLNQHNADNEVVTDAVSTITNVIANDKKNPNTSTNQRKLPLSRGSEVSSPPTTTTTTKTTTTTTATTSVHDNQVSTTTNITSNDAVSTATNDKKTSTSSEESQVSSLVTELKQKIINYNKNFQSSTDLFYFITGRGAGPDHIKTCNYIFYINVILPLVQETNSNKKKKKKGLCLEKFIDLLRISISNTKKTFKPMIWNSKDTTKGNEISDGGLKDLYSKLHNQFFVGSQRSRNIKNIEKYLKEASGSGIPSIAPTVSLYENKTSVLPQSKSESAFNSKGYTVLPSILKDSFMNDFIKKYFYTEDQKRQIRPTKLVFQNIFNVEHTGENDSRGKQKRGNVELERVEVFEPKGSHKRKDLNGKWMIENKKWVDSLQELKAFVLGDLQKLLPQLGFDEKEYRPHVRKFSILGRCHGCRRQHLHMDGENDIESNELTFIWPMMHFNYSSKFILLYISILLFDFVLS